MARPIAIGIDLGTRGVRAARVDSTGRSMLMPLDRVEAGMFAADVQGAKWRFGRPKHDGGEPYEVLLARELKQVDRSLRNDAGADLTMACTVPSHFLDYERESARNAFRIAGVPDVSLVDESTANATAYAEWLRRSRSASQVEGEDVERCVFVDVGGRHTEVTVADVSIERVSILACQRVVVGGDRLVEAFIDWLAREKSRTFDRSADRAAVEGAVHSFSVRRRAVIQAVDEDCRYEVTRDEFDAATHAVVESVGACLAAVWLRWGGDVETVVLTGGASRNIALQACIERVTGRRAERPLAVNEATARGAALCAWVGEQPARDSRRDARDERLPHTIRSIAHRTLCLEGAGDDGAAKGHKTLIEEGSELPARRSVRLPVQSVTLTVWLSEMVGEEADVRTVVGRVVLRRISEVIIRAGHVELVCHYRRDGRIRLSACVPDGVRPPQVEWERTAILSPIEVRQFERLFAMGEGDAMLPARGESKDQHGMNTPVPEDES